MIGKPTYIFIISPKKTEMSRIYLLLAFVLIMLSSCGKEEPVTLVEINCKEIGIGIDHPQHADFQSILDDLVAAGYPGVTATISDKNGLWQGSSGRADLENNIAMAPCHVSP